MEGLCLSRKFPAQGLGQEKVARPRPAIVRTLARGHLWDPAERFLGMPLTSSVRFANTTEFRAWPIQGKTGAIRQLPGALAAALPPISAAVQRPRLGRAAPVQTRPSAGTARATDVYRTTWQQNLALDYRLRIWSDWMRSGCRSRAPSSHIHGRRFARLTARCAPPRSSSCRCTVVSE